MNVHDIVKDQRCFDFKDYTYDGSGNLIQADAYLADGVFDITSVSTVATGAVTVTTTEAHNIAVGDYVHFRGISTAVELNGKTFVVASVPSTTTFTVAIAVTSGAGTGGKVLNGQSLPTFMHYYEYDTSNNLIGFGTHTYLYSSRTES